MTDDVNSAGIVTCTAIALALLATTTEKLSWLVEFQGPIVWAALLLAHGYFMISRWSRSGRLIDYEGFKQARASSPKWQRGEKPLSARADVFMRTMFVGLVAWFGLAIMFTKLALATFGT